LVFEVVQQDIVEIKYVITKTKNADGRTKRLEGAEFVAFRMEVLNLPD
jgi:hypothetical protein